MNVVIACGGTGGHLFPGLAVAERLRERGHQTLIFISKKEIDALAVKDHVADYHFEKLPSVGLPRPLSLAMLRFTRGFADSMFRCRKIYRDFRPQAVLGMGGFTSTSPMLVGRLTGVPTFIHESNAIPGKANLLNARLAKTVLLGFAECARYFPSRTHRIVTGTPIRSSLRSRLNQREACRLFGFDETGGKKTVLVMGGSQGAHGLNQAVVQALPRLKETVQVIHFTGKSDELSVRAEYEKAGMNAYVAAFHHRMQEAYSAADFAVARSGAASLSELAYFGLPSLLIPFPAAAEDHQTLNARIFVQAGAAAMLPERELSADNLATFVRGIVGDEPRLRGMVDAARTLAPGDAAALVVETLEKECQA